MSDNFGRNRNTVILGLAIAIIAMMLVATTLLNSGWETDSLLDPVSYQSNPIESVEGDSVATAPPLIGGIVMVLVIVTIMTILRHPGQALKMIVSSVILIILIGLMADRILPTVAQPEQEARPAEAGDQAITDMFDTLEVVPIETAPAWLNIAIAAGFSLSVAALGVGIYWLYVQKPQMEEEVSPIAALAEQAKDAVVQIEAGFDLRNAILNCYAQMLDTVRQNRGVSRRSNMTAHEFETQLIELELPPAAVQRLTQLFERVRYGSDDPGIREQREAVDCLNAIVTAIET